MFKPDRVKFYSTMRRKRPTQRKQTYTITKELIVFNSDWRSIESSILKQGQLTLLIKTYVFLVIDTRKFECWSKTTDTSTKCSTLSFHWILPDILKCLNSNANSLLIKSTLKHTITVLSYWKKNRHAKQNIFINFIHVFVDFSFSSKMHRRFYAWLPIFG